MNIIFTNVFDVPDEYFPMPANKVIPDWYKNLESYVDEIRAPSIKGEPKGTIKRCMPVFDAMTSGYILLTAHDVFVSQNYLVNSNTNEISNETIPCYFWPSDQGIQNHPIEQAPNHPDRKNLPDYAVYPKWVNPWAIKTPPGYSTLFVQPFHRNAPFTILPGVVDTDTYTAPVNLPFVLNDWKFEGLIPAGTPMAQVIPFKRESWKMSFGTEETLKEQQKVQVKIRSKLFDSYKAQYRQPKEYK